MSNLYKDMQVLHESFGISGLAETNQPHSLSDEEFKFRLECLYEEYKEYKEAKNLEQQIDALIDLAMFALGTLERMSVNLAPHWDAVLLSNFRKNLTDSKENSKRNFAIDLIKPKGWQAPNHAKILKGYK